MGVQSIGNESVPIQLAQCRFPGLAVSNAKMTNFIHQRVIEKNKQKTIYNKHQNTTDMQDYQSVTRV